MRLVKRIVRSLVHRIKLLQWDIYKYFKKDIYIYTKHGVYLHKVTNDDPIHKQLYLNGHYEYDFIEKTMSFLKENYNISNETLLDIGANNGVISFEMLLNGFFKKSIAVEPEPNNFNKLCKNIEFNKLEQHIDTYNIALSDSPGELSFELSDENYGDHRVRVNGSETQDNSLSDEFNESKRKTIKVKSETLTEFMKDKNASLIWMDVQGFEPYILKGGIDYFNSMQNNIPAVLEFWPYGMKRNGISKKGYVELLNTIFTHYYLYRYGRFIKYKVQYIELLWDELEYGTHFESVIFVNEKKLNEVHE